MNTNATCTCNCKKCRKIIKTLKNPKKQPLTISTMNTAIIYWLYSGIKNMISIQQPLFTMWLFKNSTTKILKMVNRLSKGILNEFPLGIFLYVPFERLHLLVVIKKKKKHCIGYTMPNTLGDEHVTYWNLYTTYWPSQTTKIPLPVYNTY